MISNKEKSYHYMYFERNKDSVTIYYNGEIYKEFNATKDVADFFNKQVNTISTKINKNKRDEEIFTRYHNVREA
jgi:nicotinamide mononucleotide adenylyltransferase